MRYATLALLLAASPAAAQYGAYPPAYGGGGYGYGGTGGYPNYGPNAFNRQTQPLSPYLNLLRGANPATNYYYGVRPGLPTGGANLYGQVPIQPQVGAMAGGFLPQSQIPYDPSAQTYEPGGVPIRLNSPGHPVLFGNQFANHGSYLSVTAQGGRGGYVGGQSRTSQSIPGLGTSNAPARGGATGGGNRGGATGRPGITAYP